MDDPAQAAPCDGRFRARTAHGEVEVDEGFIGGRNSALRGGRQRDAKALVGVAVEVRGAGSGRLRLQVLPDASGDSLGAFVAASVAAGAIVHTDGWQGYAGLNPAGFDHTVHTQRARHPDYQFLLPRAHRDLQPQDLAAGHPPRRLARAPAGLLDEFVFRHKRRRTPLAAFQTLLGLAGSHEPTTYRQITTHAQRAA